MNFSRFAPRQRLHRKHAGLDAGAEDGEFGGVVVGGDGEEAAEGGGVDAGGFELASDFCVREVFGEFSGEAVAFDFGLHVEFEIADTEEGGGFLADLIHDDIAVDDVAGVIPAAGEIERGDGGGSHLN